MCLALAGGVFTACIGNVTLELTRDEDAADLLSSGQTGLAFIGSDKLEEWTLAGRVASTSIIDTLPIDCQMVLAGPKRNVWEIPTRLGKRELMTVATSYPKLLGKFAVTKGLNLAVTDTPKGGCEAWALTGRTDLVFEIRNKGDTIRDNDLVVYREGEKLRLNVLDAIELRDPVEDQLTTALKAVARTYTERLRQARDDSDRSSYTIELLRDSNKLVKKLFEEFGELAQAIIRCPTNKAEIVNEAADLLYPLGIYLAINNLDIVDVLEEDVLRNRKARQDGGTP